MCHISCHTCIISCHISLVLPIFYNSRKYKKTAHLRDNTQVRGQISGGDEENRTPVKMAFIPEIEGFRKIMSYICVIHFRKIIIDHIIEAFPLIAECRLIDFFESVIRRPAAALHSVLIGHTEIEHDRCVDVP